MAVGNLIEKVLFSSCQGSFVPCSVCVGAGLAGSKDTCQRSSHQRLVEEQDLRELLSRGVQEPSPLGVQGGIGIYCLPINSIGFSLQSFSS